MGDSDRLARAFAAIDAANRGDPNRVEIRGAERPKEQAHAELMTEWVRRLDPEADEAQLLAARAHHLRRWTVPRTTYPEGRAGYLRWRTALRHQHAEEVTGILEAAGYDQGTVGRVQQIIRKEGLGTDPAVQTHEDALCLVFLETQLADTAERLGTDRMVDVLQKTAAKMSPVALAAALGLAMRDDERDLIESALGAPAPTPRRTP